jgi:hypothetical protein
MGGHKPICLLYQHGLRGSSISKFIRTYSGFRERRREPYNLPRLVIDLDSNDNKHVRQAEDGEPYVDDKPNPKLGGHEREQGGWHTVRLRGWKNNGPLQTRSTTPLDILGYVLEGDPVPPGHPSYHVDDPYSELREIFEERQIRPSDKPRDKIAQLLYGFSSDESLNLRAAGFGVESDESIRDQVEQRYTSFSKFCRAISMLSSTVDGCRFLAANGDAVAAGIKSIHDPGRRAKLSTPEPTVLHILRLLNNLRLNMNSKGVDIGSDLCNTALYYSAMTFQFESMRTYLQIMVEKGYPTNQDTYDAISCILHKIGPAPGPQADLSKPAADIDFRQTILSLITDCAPYDASRPVEQRKPCFASLLPQDHNEDYSVSLYPAYIITLGKLGESEALLREYTARRDSHLPQILRGEENSTRKACLLAVAFVLARDLENAAAVLQTGFAHGSHGGEGDVTWPVVSHLYLSHGITVTPAFELVLRGPIGNDWQSALEMIKRFIDYDGLVASEPGNTTWQQHVDWVENQDGVRQAVVKDLTPL